MRAHFDWLWHPSEGEMKYAISQSSSRAGNSLTKGGWPRPLAERASGNAPFHPKVEGCFVVYTQERLLRCNGDRLRSTVSHGVVAFALDVVEPLLSRHFPWIVVGCRGDSTKQVVVDIKLDSGHCNRIRRRRANRNFLVARHSTAICRIGYANCEIGGRNRVVDIHRHNCGKPDVTRRIVGLGLNRVSAIHHSGRIEEEVIRRGG